MKFISTLILIFSLTIFSIPVLAAEDSYPQFVESFKGFMTYRQYETFESVNAKDPYMKKSLDLNVFEMTGEYKLSPVSELEFEIEFEHGGTGSTIEFEPLEEFGEFESEVEKGGEVVISELYYLRALGNMTWVKAGKIPVPISLGNVQRKYVIYPSVYSSAAEGSMIPAEWRELGFQLQKRFDSNFNIQLLATSGLNSEFFRTYNWVGGGNQKQFETVNAENWAGTIVLEYGDVATSDGVALGVYYGETSGNRHKLRKLNDKATLMIGSLMGTWTWIDDLTVRGQIIRGSLSNSDKVSLANSTLAASVNPGAYSQLGSTAQMEMAEVSYRFLQGDESATRGFVSYEHVDSMVDVEGAVIKNDRFNQLFSSVGLMQIWDKIFFAKLQYTKHSNALSGLPATDDYQLALGFDWYGYNL